MRWLLILFSLFVLMALGGGALGVWGLYHYGRGLPDYRQLADYDPPVVTRVHAGDGRLLTEYAKEKRVFVPVSAMPKRIIHAFLSAEDKNFYNHPGIDFISLGVAIVDNIKNYGKRRPRGASTITQQVAKNFLLTNETSIERKAKEAILAFRIERAFTKDRILELYLNEIYLGFRSYGVAAAALNYFDKSLDELSVEEAAYLAALPKAPNNYHPVRKAQAAKTRRDWVIGQMVENGFVSAADGEAAKARPLTIRPPSRTEIATAEYFAEEVRRELVDRLGESGAYGGGLSVRTTLDPELQRYAEAALRYGLQSYDRRHGWRGPVSTLPVVAGWGQALEAVERPKGALDPWRMALALIVEAEAVQIGFPDGTLGVLPLSELKWAREWKEDQRVGGSVKRADQVLTPGDVILVEAVETSPDGETAYEPGTYGLRQVPEIEGGIVALDPHTGRVLAMSGGWSHAESQFNRATQASRQPGSAFKPFVYLAGIEKDFTPASIVEDGPIVIDQGPGLGKWKPSNYTDKFYGPTPLRVGLEKSRNLMTVRVAQQLGMPPVVDIADRFNIDNRLSEQLSMSLGAGETTLLRMTTGYAMLVNGGREIVPTFIDRIQDRTGKAIFRHDNRDCRGCRAVTWTPQPVPELPDTRRRLTDPASAFQVTWMLKGVIDRGTGRRISTIGKPMGGKTGTTNDAFDAWFVGFSPDLAVGTYVGFDQPRTLGPRESGSSVAVPIFKRFMEKALAEAPATPFRRPPGIRFVRIDRETGMAARPGDSDVIEEAFKPGTEPSVTALRPSLPPATVAPVLGSPLPWPPPAASRPSVADGATGLY